MARDSIRRWRRRTYELLERGSASDAAATAIERALVVLIVLNLVAVALESVPSFAARFRPWFTMVEAVSLGVFTLEYVLRLWVAVEHPPYHHVPHARARLRYALSAAGLVDLLAILPFWFAFMLPDELRVVLVFRFVRFMKIARYSPAMRSLLDVLYRERRALLGCFVILFGTALVCAALMYLAERNVQPEKLGTIPDAFWWSIVTLSTIGYGDVVPVTPLGKLVAIVSVLLGMIMIALPVGIIATAFSEQIHSRDFIVTWGMIARVPLFAELDAAEIASIMEMLRSQFVEPGQTIVRKGDAAHSMYFIAAGAVEVDLKSRRVQLAAGQFFGEMAVMRRSRRSATVRAITRTQLLVLDARDLHTLISRDTRVATRIKDVMSHRQDALAKSGDIAPVEVEPGKA